MLDHAASRDGEANLTRTRRILITGIPGTGKTSLGHYYHKSKEYTHHNFEDVATLRKLQTSSEAFLRRLIRLDGNVIITWGFPVNDWSLRIIDQLRSNGFRLVWFDGDREAARKIFNRRGTVPEWLFRLQINGIEATRVVERLRPIVIDPFDEDGELKAFEDLYRAVEQCAFGAS